jgi:hypothetical protein
MVGCTSPNGVHEPDADVDAHEAPLVGPGVPIGTVLAFAGPVAPEGWLACDGSEVGRDDYPELFGTIGVAHGGGDGATTFHLPDYRGRFLRGVDDGAGRDLEAELREEANDGGNRGDRVGSVQGPATALPSAPFEAAMAGEHRHGYEAASFDWLRVSSTTGIVVPHAGRAIETDPAGQHGHEITGGDAETRPENAAVLFVIRAE